MDRQVLSRDVDEGIISAVRDVICVFVFKDSPDSLAMKHRLDVSTYFSLT
jgi:hypothetical protein